MIEIRKVLKKEIPALLADTAVWKHEFLSATKHRMMAHFTNPNCGDDDTVLLLAYMDEELVGYMGVYVDKIILKGQEQKIGWLSTWWVHPKTKGTGIGKEILNTMYALKEGKIGISAFTESAKRVYDKSGYFVTLKTIEGVKAVMRLDSRTLLPLVYPKLAPLKSLLCLADAIANAFISLKLVIKEAGLRKKLRGVKIEYMNIIDDEVRQLIGKYSTGHISNKTPEFFQWLKAYHWVQEAPLFELTEKDLYEFSMCDPSYNIYLLKVMFEKNCAGFMVLQKRNKTIRLLFAYYDRGKHAEQMANLLMLQGVRQKVNEIISYDDAINAEMKKSGLFVYTRHKVTESIISKAFQVTDFSDVVVNLGDGDSCFT
jgi:GNAT superfamily N-acetyltransferase